MMSCPSWIGKDLPSIRRNGEEFFLLGFQDKTYLIRNACPHRGGPLKFGWVNHHEEIVCPMHYNTFSIHGLIRQPSTQCLDELSAVLP